MKGPVEMGQSLYKTHPDKVLVQNKFDLKSLLKFNNNQALLELNAM